MQNPVLEILIVGSGLGGCCAALWLSEQKQVGLLTGTAPAASAVAAGLVNPFAGQRMGGFQEANPTYKDFLHTLSRADAHHCYNPCGVLRPALTDEQASRFRAVSHEKPASMTWFCSDQVREVYPYISASRGAALTTGGVIDTPQLLSRMRKLLSSRCMVLRENLVEWHNDGSALTIALSSGRSLRAKKLILAVGADYPSIPVLKSLKLHRTKGQIVTISALADAPITVPISGHGYAVPIDNRIILGTTYEHSPSNTAPTDEGTQKILNLTQKMLPSVRSASILSTSAGIRVGVPGTRLPMVGPLTKNIWVLTGLGSKGLLLGSYIGRNLETWMTNPAAIPDNFRIQSV